jgi:hypothetical protein
MQCRLKDADVQNTLAQCHRGWVHGDEGLGYLDKSGIAELTFKIAINIPAIAFSEPASAAADALQFGRAAA